MTSPRTRQLFPWLVFLGVFVTALSMRSPIVAPTPVMQRISDAFEISTGTAGLLTSAPILMFAVLTPLAALVIRRRGPEFAVLATLVGVMVGTVIRTIPGFGWMLAGMLIIGAAIAIGNVVVPVIIRRDAPPGRVAFLTAVYTAMLNLGSLLTTLFTAPLADALGWSVALLAWILLAIAGLLLWIAHMRRPRRELGVDLQSPDLTPKNSASARPSVLAVIRRPLTLMLMLCFAMQSASYYSLTTWLPTIAAEDLDLSATAAGALSSIFQGVAVIGAFLVPLLLRWMPLRAAIGVIGAAWITVTLGMATAPAWMPLWMIIGAIAQAGGFVAILSLMVAGARSDGEAATMSATVQGGGYIFAALGAPLTGWLHDISGGWALPLWVLVAATTVFAVTLVIAATIVRRP